MPVRAAVRARDPGTLVPRPDALPCDLATVSDAQKAVTVANGAALAYAGSPAMTDPTLLGRLSGFAVPTMVVWGESDQIAKPAHGQAYSAAIDGARFTVLPATGHMPQVGESRSRPENDLDGCADELVGDPPCDVGGTGRAIR
jgi:pimeloyl-ACP methyl ester carboxylesterase